MREQMNPRIEENKGRAGTPAMATLTQLFSSFPQSFIFFFLPDSRTFSLSIPTAEVPRYSTVLAHSPEDLLRKDSPEYARFHFILRDVGTIVRDFFVYFIFSMIIK